MSRRRFPGRSSRSVVAAATLLALRLSWAPRLRWGTRDRVAARCGSVPRRARGARRAARGRRALVAARASPAATRSSPRLRRAHRGRRRRISAASRTTCSASATTSRSAVRSSSTSAPRGLHQRLDNALDVQTARAHGAGRARRGRARRRCHAVRPQARTLLGILTFGASAQGGGPSQVDAAISDFTDAIRADPDDDDAKFDLELLLRADRRARGSRRAAAPAAASAGPAGTARAAACRGAATDDVPDAARRSARRSPRSLPLAAALVRRQTRGARCAARSGWRRRRRRSGCGRLARGAAGIALLGLAAAQPALTHESSGAGAAATSQALFVLDTSRSMAASATADVADPARPRGRGGGPAARRDPGGRRPASPRSPTACCRICFPVADMGGFDGVVRRAVAIESPPPRESERARDDLLGARRHRRRQLLRPVRDAPHRRPAHRRREHAGRRRRDRRARCPAARGYRFVAIRFWQAHESGLRQRRQAGGRRTGRTPPGTRSSPGSPPRRRPRLRGERSSAPPPPSCASSAGQGPTRSRRAERHASRVPLAPYRRRSRAGSVYARRGLLPVGVLSSRANIRKIVAPMTRRALWRTGALIVAAVASGVLLASAAAREAARRPTSAGAASATRRTRTATRR